MNLKLIFIPVSLLLFIGCDSISESKIYTPSSGNCLNGESMGCDDICSSIPLENDVCGVCGGDGATCEGLWNIYYEVSVPFAAFQFDVNGITVISASGGSAEETGFMVSSSSITVIGFSLSGDFIPAGSGVLTQIKYDGDLSDACFTDLVLSDSDGGSIPATIENCNTIKY
ncbi:MAG: hypothetical protein H8E85_04560 [Candidatus Marinimicrobia bacterium]|nr:hypothetical protein [Candidatus Neomarinimicrobiota bacterium]